MGEYIQQYTYDEVGNILSMRHRGVDPSNPGWKRCYQYAMDSNRLLSTSNPNTAHNPDDPCPTDYAAAPVYAEKYGYDAHGNMKKMPHLPIMNWDFKDQLQMVDLNGGGKAYYVYDASGQRVRKVHEHNGTTVEERIYLGGFEIYRKRNSTGLKLRRETLHIMDDERRIALVETKTHDEGGLVPDPTYLIRYQFGNHLGSASLELDENAEIISYEEYYPYGSTSYQAVRGGIEVSPKRYRYTGKERDEESGLYYHGARYFAPWLGRWISTDPAGFVSGLNLFAYTSNNPTNRVDPTGTQEYEGAVVVLGRWDQVRPDIVTSETRWPPVGKSPIPPPPELRLYIMEGLGVEKFVNLPDVVPGTFSTPGASGKAVRTLLAGGSSSGFLDIYFDLRGLEELVEAGDQFHSTEEFYAIWNHFLEGGTYEGEIFFRHSDDTFSRIAPGTTEITPFDPAQLLEKDFGRPMSKTGVLQTLKGLSRAKKLAIILGVTGTALGPLADTAEAATGVYHIGAGIEKGPGAAEGQAHFRKAREGFGSLAGSSGTAVVLGWGGAASPFFGLGMMAIPLLLGYELSEQLIDLEKALKKPNADPFRIKEGQAWAKYNRGEQLTAMKRKLISPWLPAN